LSLVASLRPVRGTPREILALLRSWEAGPGEPEPLVVETSGSTGEPKRVVLSRAAMRASATATHDRLGGPGQWLLNLPATYVAGLQVLFRSVLAGTDPVVQDEHDGFAAAAAAMTGSRRYVSLVPTQLVRMLGSDRDVQALRRFDTVLVGGARTDPAVRESAEAAGVRVVATYGMSETCGGCVYDAMPLDGVAVAVGTDGRVRIGGPVLFDGYDGRPELTARVRRDGWFVTSDLGRLDDDGRLEVLGRVDDVVVSGGMNVPAPAVAARLREHPAVAAAEAVGVDDPEWGQRVVAVVVPVPGTEPPSLEGLRDFVAEAHPRAWAPRGLAVVEEIPLLDNGKVDRLALAQVAGRGASVSRPPGEHP
jgi:O-succinylbenzoic acid--CoA ligase